MNYTNEEILRVAMAQSAVDAGCRTEDFMSGENKVVISSSAPGARKYLTLPHFCSLISYGNNIVASVDGRFRDAAADYMARFSWHGCFETPNMRVLEDLLRPFGYGVCFMAEYFLPDVTVLTDLPCRYERKILTSEDFETLYTDEWQNALCAKRRELDILGVGAYDNGKPVGLAACSADCESMWQIGIDVLPDYRRRGIASSLTSRLALEILKRDKVPFYCCAWSNIPSARNAVRSGFRPAWAELTAKSEAFIDEINNVK